MDDYIRIITPLLNLATFVSLETIIVIFVNEINELPGLNPAFVARLILVLVLLGVLSAIVLSTGLGIVPSYKGDWSRGLPAVPLFEWHILLAVLFSIATVFLEANRKTANFARLDLAICVAIWMFASFLWTAQPIIPNPSALKPHEPNFEIYPFIDSQTYDLLAQSVLVGEGFGEGIPLRILYVTFLVIAHVLVGQGYEAMIDFQSLVFAFFPVLLYLFGRRFFGRPVGVSIALLAILRDFTSNLVSPFTGNLSYSKVYLSEIPTAMFLVLLLIIGIRWIKEEFPAYSGFLLGGVIGLAMLIRTQTSVAFPVFMVFGFLIRRRKIKPLLTGVLVMALGLVITISPWLWRNWQLTGEIIFDSPEYQMANLAVRYNRLNGVEPDITSFDGESPADYSERLKNMALFAIRSDPQKAVWGVVNTFLNHGVNNILLFPLRYELVKLSDFWIPEDAFWEEWVGVPTTLQSILLVFYLFLFGLGVAVAWHRSGWLGLLPLGLNLAYNLWTSLALLSGQRFMVAMDWSIYFYYMIGIFTLLGGFAMMLTAGRPVVMNWIRENSPNEFPVIERPRPAIRRYFYAGLFFLLIGALPVLVERVFPEKYPPRADAEILPSLLTSPSLAQADIEPACLEKLDAEGLLSYVEGRALYPRYYAAGDGEKFTDSIGYRVADENRLVFEFVGQENTRVILPLSGYADFSPHASDATLVYGPDGALWFVFVEKDAQQGFYVSKFFDRALCK
ncbi:MAG: hypothetical protein HND47_01535 [Chloroflexi bacterium]|nr:hypothetical protein [Chloroflexota bacterium]